MKKKPNKKMRNIIAAIITLIAIVVFVQNNESSEKDFKGATETSYSEFLSMVDNKKVKEVHFYEPRDHFFFKTQDDKIFKTDNPEYDDFKKEMLESGVKVLPLKPKISYLGLLGLVPSLAFYGLIFYYFKATMEPALAKKKSIVSEKPKVKFSDVAGLDESMSDLQYVVDFLKNPSQYNKAGAKLPKGVVLYGPPGTGKTLTAKAIAGEANVPFLSVSGSDFIEMYAGLGAKRVRDLFKEARTNAPCILFIDEIDSVGRKRERSVMSEEIQTINALLAEMDGFSTKEGIIVLAATNRVEDLDSALLRPGRFDRHVAISLPDFEARLEILKIHAKNKKLSSDINMEELGKITIGFSGAALEMILNESAINAAKRGDEIIRKEDIDEAYYKTIMKGVKKPRGKDSDKNEVRIVAYHEAGHAFAAKTLTSNDVPRVSIVPSSNGAGGVTFNIPKKMGLLTKDEVLAEIKVLYAGRAAEEILSGKKSGVTTGASSDIDRATDLIMGYFEDYGFSEEYGLLKLTKFTDKGYYAKEAKKLSLELYEEIKQHLQDNWDKVSVIANELMEKENIDGEDLDRILF